LFRGDGPLLARLAQRLRGRLRRGRSRAAPARWDGLDAAERLPPVPFVQEPDSDAREEPRRLEARVDAPLPPPALSRARRLVRGPRALRPRGGDPARDLVERDAHTRHAPGAASRATAAARLRPRADAAHNAPDFGPDVPLLRAERIGREGRTAMGKI